jgi:hypothetical protein
MANLSHGFDFTAKPVKGCFDFCFIVKVFESLLGYDFDSNITL